MNASFKLGRIAGIEIGIHYTWLFAFALVSWSLASGFFPAYYPGWEEATYWVTGILAALLLFTSVLVHELAHSLVARARGLGVESITLFVFGGVSGLRSEPSKAWDEFRIAIVGPLTSIALAGLFWGVRLAVGDGKGPVEAMFTYLALINAILAGFNLVPGFPLDGGRVLRSILWRTTGSLVRATNIAAGVGQAVGWGIIGWGVYNFLGGNVLGGLWIGLIGWFLTSAADTSRKELAVREAFRGVTVADVMERDPGLVGPGLSLAELVDEYLLRRGRRAMCVGVGGDVAGIVTITDAKRVPRERWGEVSVGEVMTRPPLKTVGGDDDLGVALQTMAQDGLNQLPVVDGGRLVGMLDRAAVIRYVQLSRELESGERGRGRR